jgi:elongator complex protein 3
VYGFVKLRFNSEKARAYLPTEIQGAALIRWLQVYGMAVSITDVGRRDGSVQCKGGQHRGLGMRLMAAAEAIVRKEGFDRVADISGIGAREYYRKMGYTLEGTYMVKRLTRKAR